MTASPEPVKVVTFRQPIAVVSRNLEALRDFVDVLDSVLGGQMADAMKEHTEGIAPLLIAMGRAGMFDKADASAQMTPEGFDAIANSMPAARGITLSAPDERGRRSVTFDRPPGEEFNKALKALSRASARTQMLYSSSLLNLTGSVELFVSQLLHAFFTLYPAAIGTREKVFSLEDLSGFDTVGDARSHYILSRIENVMRSSFDDWLVHLRTDLKLKMGYLASDQPRLSEAFQRRNVIVHNGAVANSIYFSNVPASLRPGVAIGDDLTPSRKYLNDLIDLFEQNCMLVGAELWKKTAPDADERSDLLMDVGYEHLKAGRYSIAAALMQFVVDDKAMSEGTRTTAQLNLWLASKRLGKWESVQSAVEGADYSARSLRFQLGLLGLTEKYDDFYALLPRAISGGELSVDELRSFPILEEMRTDSRFQAYAESPVPAPKRKRRRSAAREVVVDTLAVESVGSDRAAAESASPDI